MAAIRSALSAGFSDPQHRQSPTTGITDQHQLASGKTALKLIDRLIKAGDDLRAIAITGPVSRLAGRSYRIDRKILAWPRQPGDIAARMNQRQAQGHRIIRSRIGRDAVGSQIGQPVAFQEYG